MSSPCRTQKIHRYPLKHPDWFTYLCIWSDTCSFDHFWYYLRWECKVQLVGSHWVFFLFFLCLYLFAGPPGVCLRSSLSPPCLWGHPPVSNCLLPVSRRIWTLSTEPSVSDLLAFKRLFLFPSCIPTRLDLINIFILSLNSLLAPRWTPPVLLLMDRWVHVAEGFSFVSFMNFIRFGVFWGFFSPVIFSQVGPLGRCQVLIILNMPPMPFVVGVQLIY